MNWDASELPRALLLIAVLSGLPLAVSTVTGVVVSVLQAVTQIQEQTLTFVPKLASVVLLFTILGGWMWGQMEEYLCSVLYRIPLAGN